MPGTVQRAKAGGGEVGGVRPKNATQKEFTIKTIE